MTWNAEFRDRTAKLIDLLTKKIATLRELERMTHIADALDMDMREFRKYGTARVSVRTGYIHPLWSKPWRRDTLTITIEGQEPVTKRLCEVHPSLWPPEVRDEYEREQKRIARRKERLAQKVTPE